MVWVPLRLPLPSRCLGRLGNTDDVSVVCVFRLTSLLVVVDGFRPETGIGRSPPALTKAFLRGLNVKPALRSMLLRPAALDRLTMAPTSSVPEVEAQGFPSPRAVKISRSPVADVAISLLANGAEHLPVWRLVVPAPIQYG